MRERGVCWPATLAPYWHSVGSMSLSTGSEGREGAGRLAVAVRWAEQRPAADTGERGSSVGGVALYRSPVRLRPGVRCQRRTQNPGQCCQLSTYYSEGE